jgi:hypothetical protein
VEGNVASSSRVGQRIWTCPLEAGQTVDIGIEKAFEISALYSCLKVEPQPASFGDTHRGLGSSLAPKGLGTVFGSHRLAHIVRRPGEVAL